MTMESLNGLYPESLTLSKTENPYLDYYKAYQKKHQLKNLSNVFSPDISEEERIELFDSVDSDVADKYAWAIPTEQALKIIQHYGPIVEMGCGKGYWGRLLQLRGCDIICYDLHAEEKEITFDEKNEKKEILNQDEELLENQTYDDENSEEDENMIQDQRTWLNVLKGTPEKLRGHNDRTLFLCYPDDFEDSDESMALACLENYTGDTIIHVGELFGHTICLPSPWGRTSASEFQERLHSIYHKILQIPLPSWHSSMDTLTIWKRTQTCIVDDQIFAYIPTNEQISLTMTCPTTQHLLEHTKNDNEDKDKRVSKKKKRSLREETLNK